MIDVNSGSFIGRGKGAGLEDTITKTNLEAAEEVVNQLRLRDIGGIIVIDFIDMARARNRDAVMKTLRKTLDEDRTKTFTAEISKLGLVEMTRQNVTEGVREIMTSPCPTCDGEGVIRSEETIAIEFERKLRDVAVEHPDDEAFLVQINPRVSTQFTGHGSRVLHALEADTGKSFLFEGSEGLTLDHFAITFTGTREQVEERALPFRQATRSRRDRRAPHVRRRRRGGENRRLHHLDRRRRRLCRREANGTDRPGRSHGRERAAARRVRRGGQRARASERLARRRARQTAFGAGAGGASAASPAVAAIARPSTARTPRPGAKPG